MLQPQKIHFYPNLLQKRRQTSPKGYRVLSSGLQCALKGFHVLSSPSHLCVSFALKAHIHLKKKNPNQISSGPQSPLSISVSVRKGCHSLHTPRLPLMHMDSPPTRLRHHTPASLCSIFLKESFYYRRREPPPPLTVPA